MNEWHDHQPGWTKNNNTIVMEGQLHRQLYAMVGVISVDKVEELLTLYFC